MSSASSVSRSREPESADRAPSAPLSQSTTIVNSCGMPLTRIAPGEFLMGSGESLEELAAAFPAYDRKPFLFQDEYPRHPVHITPAFWLGTHPVTIGQFRRFVEESGYRTDAERDGTGGCGYDGVNRRFVGLIMEGEALPEVKSAIRKGDKEVGYITTSLFSPGLEKPIALGFVARTAYAPGTAVEVLSEGKTIPAKIVDLPFPMMLHSAG